MDRAKDVISWHSKNTTLTEAQVQELLGQRKSRENQRFARKIEKVKAANAAEKAHRIAKLGSLNAVASDTAYNTLHEIFKNAAEALKVAKEAIDIDSDAENAIEDPVPKSEDANERASKLIEVLSPQ